MFQALHVNALFIIVLILLAAIAYAIYRTLPSSSPIRELPPMSPRQLFDQVKDAESAPSVQVKNQINERQLRAEILQRLQAGELIALEKAHDTGDTEFYRTALHEAFLRAVSSQPELRRLANLITKSKGLRASNELVQAYLALWKQQPERTTTIELLHLAALTDDAEVFLKATEVVSQGWRDRLISELTAEELRALLDSEYWTLSSDARRTGAGFILKDTLTRLRIELLRESELPSQHSKH